MDLRHVVWTFIFLLLASKTYAADEAYIQAKMMEDKTDISPLRQDGVAFTHHIGTPDEPTIDGKPINSTVPAPEINIVESPLKESKAAFEDSWATSDKVKKILDSAASDGKLGYVMKKTKAMGLPASVAVVPIVESAYQTQAVSPKGAAGAWQLMPATAKAYGLNKEQRFEFTTSTDAALRLLRDLHQQFGNWELAFASYNAGSQRVSKALEKNPSAKTIDDLSLPMETKTYVKRMIQINATLESM